MSYVRPQLESIAEQLKNGEVPEPQTVRTLLSWFNAQRRSLWNVYMVRAALQELGIATEPDFELTYIDGPVSFVLRPEEVDTSQLGSQTAAGGGVTGEAPSPETIELPDPTYRVGMLQSANQTPVSVKPSTTIEEATTLMLQHDFSQLPVMTSERDVKGVVSWRSLGTRLGLGISCATAGDCMEPAHVISDDTSLFATIDAIVENDYVLIRHVDQRVGGIVTTADLSLQFRQLAEPFLLLSEIENHVRRLIQVRFTPEELEEVLDPSDEREVGAVHDLTFGEYIRLLENPERWDKLALKLDRVTFVKALDEIRRIRNDVMHFDPDPIAPADMTKLQNFSQMMQVLRQAGAV